MAKRTRGDLPHGGGGIVLKDTTFTVTSAYIKEWVAYKGQPAGSALIYEVEVELPDGTVQASIGFDHNKADADLTPGHDTPVNQAIAHMKTRLTSKGATRVTDL